MKMKKVLIIIATIVLMSSMLALTISASSPTASPELTIPDMSVYSSSSTTDGNTTSGNKILDSDLWKSFLTFLQNATTVIAIACPVICVICIIIYATRMAMADEQDHPRWTKRIKICLVIAVVGSSASGIIALLLSYVPKG